MRWRSLDFSPSTGPDPESVDDDLNLPQVAATLAAHGGGPGSASLALDLVLHKIVEQACRATRAGGAAIALSRGNRMVCRATTGKSAADLGVRLNTRSGLSGACFRTRQVQYCEDAFSDDRVNAETCRSLDIRSILVVPFLEGNQLLGIFEIVSPQPHAFGEQDVHTLQAFSSQVIQSIHQTRQVTIVKSGGRVSRERAASSDGPGLSGDIETAAGVAEPHRGYWTGVLTALVIALALLLGWMLGRAGLERASSLRETRPASTTQPATHPPTLATNASGQPSAESSPKIEALSNTPARRDPRPELPPGGLVVYENGKIIFRMEPGENRGSVDASRRSTSDGEEPSVEFARSSEALEIPGDVRT